VYWRGGAEPDSGIPEGVGGHAEGRVLRAPADGVLEVFCNIGDQLKHTQPVASVQGQVILAPFDGVLRGMLFPGLPVSLGMKIGDIDPRNDPALCSLVSDKALAIGGGVLEAILSTPELRTVYWRENGFITGADSKPC
jgi:xanthine dehydrogenase accessory factor